MRDYRNFRAPKSRVASCLFPLNPHGVVYQNDYDSRDSPKETIQEVGQTLTKTGKILETVAPEPQNPPAPQPWRPPALRWAAGPARAGPASRRSWPPVENCFEKYAGRFKIKERKVKMGFVFQTQKASPKREATLPTRKRKKHHLFPRSQRVKDPNSRQAAEPRTAPPAARPVETP